MGNYGSYGGGNTYVNSLIMIDTDSNYASNDYNRFACDINDDSNKSVILTDNKQRVKNTNIKKGDFKALEKTLTDNGVEKSDVTELQTIIDADTPDQNNKEFGPKVKEWVKKMFGKATDTTWKVGIGVAGKLLADSIQQYYGWK